MWLAAFAYESQPLIRPDMRWEFYLVLGIIVLTFLRMIFGKDKYEEEFVAGATGLGFTRIKPEELPYFGFFRVEQFRGAFQGSRAGMDCFLTKVVEGSGSSAVLMTKVMYRKTGDNLPAFEVVPNDFIDRMASKLARTQVTIEHPEFSAKYLLFSMTPHEPERVKALFTPAVCDAFAQLPSQKWYVRSHEDTLLMHHNSRWVKKNDMPQFLDEAETMAGSIFAAEEKAAGAS